MLDYLCFTANKENSTITAIKGDSQELYYSLDRGYNWKPFCNVINYLQHTDINFIITHNAKSNFDLQYIKGPHPVPNTKIICVIDNIKYICLVTGTIDCPVIEYEDNNISFKISCWGGTGYLFNIIKGDLVGKALQYWEFEVEKLIYDIIRLENIGDTVFFKGKIKSGCFIKKDNALNFIMTGSIIANGNIMSLIDESCTSISTTDNCFYSLFYNCSSLIKAPKLPATVLGKSCYDRMFYGCTALKVAPALPATKLADYCYYYMFANCSLLLIVPKLPKAAIANYCYFGMFDNCKSLITNILV